MWYGNSIDDYKETVISETAAKVEPLDVKLQFGKIENYCKSIAQGILQELQHQLDFKTDDKELKFFSKGPIEVTEKIRASIPYSHWKPQKVLLGVANSHKNIVVRDPLSQLGLANVQQQLDNSISIKKEFSLRISYITNY